MMVLFHAVSFMVFLPSLGCGKWRDSEVCVRSERPQDEIKTLVSTKLSAATDTHIKGGDALI